MPGRRGRLGTIMPKGMPVETVSKWPMQRPRAVMLRDSDQAEDNLTRTSVGLGDSGL